MASISWIFQFFNNNYNTVRLSKLSYMPDANKIEVAYMMMPSASLAQLKNAHAMLQCIMNSLADNDICEITKLHSIGWYVNPKP